MSAQEESIGVEIIVTVVDASNVALDISGASTKEFIFQKPDKTVVTKTADFYTNGADGKLVYTTVADDLKPHGTWRGQAHVVKAGVINGRTKVFLFDVLDNILLGG